MERLSADDPRSIGGFRLLGRLGEGGMGRVYLARSTRGRTVAVKVVKNELARQPDFRRRFAQEIVAARRVGAAWTAPVLDADTEAETPWVATGYIAGPSLAEVVDEQYGPLPPESVTALASGLVRALRDIHNAGLVHRDLKPSNILITIDGPRVIDFGIARALDSAVQSAGGLTRTGALVGSPGFMSPEQVRGLQVTPASDIFCLGAVLAYAATGKMPFGTSDSGVHALLFRIASEEPELSGISGQLHELVANCLTKEPEGRPGLAELIARTEDEVAGAWLPGEVLAQLGRHAVQLLDSEDPETDGVGSGGSGGSGESGAAGVAGMTGGFMPSAPSAFSTPTPTPTPSTPPPAAPSTPLPSTPPPAASTPPPSTPSTPPHGPMAGAYGPPAGSPYAAPRQPWQQPPGQAAFQHGPGFAGPGPGVGPAPGPGIGPAAPPSSGALQRPVHSPRKLAQGVTVLLSLTLIMNVICLFVLGIVDASLSDTPSIIADTANLESVSGFYGLKSVTLTVEAISALLGIPLIVLWLMWFWRVRVNAEAFAPGRIRLSSGMAVGAWFIPVCNLFMPKQVINDVWNASNPAVAPWYGHGPRPTSKRGLVNWWWVLWLLYFCFGSLASYESWYDMDNVQAAQETNALALFVELLGVPATIVAMTFVSRLTSLQDGKLTGRG